MHEPGKPGDRVPLLAYARSVQGLLDGASNDPGARACPGEARSSLLSLKCPRAEYVLPDHVPRPVARRRYVSPRRRSPGPRLSAVRRVRATELLPCDSSSHRRGHMAMCTTSLFAGRRSGRSRWVSTVASVEAGIEVSGLQHSWTGARTYLGGPALCPSDLGRQAVDSHQPFPMRSRRPVRLPTGHDLDNSDPIIERSAGSLRLGRPGESLRVVEFICAVLYQALLVLYSRGRGGRVESAGMLCWPRT